MFSSRAGYADAIAGSFHQPPTSSESPPSPVQRNGSVTTTRAMSYSHGAGGVSIERQLNAPSDDDIIMVTVRVSSNTRRQSYDEALPARSVLMCPFISRLTM